MRCILALTILALLLRATSESQLSVLPTILEVKNDTSGAQVGARAARSHAPTHRGHAPTQAHTRAPIHPCTLAPTHPRAHAKVIAALETTLLLMLMGAIVSSIMSPRELTFIRLPTGLMEFVLYESTVQAENKAAAKQVRKDFEEVRHHTQELRRQMSRHHR